MVVRQPRLHACTRQESPAGLRVPPRGSDAVRRMRLAATAALASAVWAGAVATGVSMTYGAPDLIHAIGHRLDPDGFPPDHTTSRSGDRHS